MRRVDLSAALSLALLSPPVAAAQSPQPPALQSVDYVKPGMNQQWEESRRELVAFMTEHEYPFQNFVFASDEGAYLTVTVIQGWDGMDRRRQWAIDNDLAAQEFSRQRREAVRRRDQSFWRLRSDLGYTPDNPRLSQDEEGFAREGRFYLQLGTNAEAEEVREAMQELYQRHTIRNGYFVVEQITGAEGPIMSVYIPSRDAADYFEQNAVDTETMGDELRELRQRMLKLSRNVEWVNWTTRPDLEYEPPAQ